MKFGGSMKAIGIIFVVSLLLLNDCMALEKYIQVEDSITGRTSQVQKSVIDWFVKGNQLRSNESCESAILCYDKAIELDPSYEPAWVNKGYCLKSLGRFDEALNAFENSTKLNPLIYGVWDEMGDILLEKREYDLAIRAYNISIELDPNYANAWLGKGRALAWNGEYDEALRSCCKIK
jgi:tetratricopeptide (TPR) repeat protein